MTQVIIIISIIIVALMLIPKKTPKGITNVDVASAKELIKDSTVTILDVRTPGEYATGHIKRSKLIPVAELAARISELESLKDKPILVYCHSGNRSLSASHILSKHGFTKVSNLRGGITAWTAGGNPTVQ